MLSLLYVVNTAFAGGTVSENQIISSESLGYDLMYRVYLPEG